MRRDHCQPRGTGHSRVGKRARVRSVLVVPATGSGGDAVPDSYCPHVGYDVRRGSMGYVGRH